ncbi:MAG: ABC transporter substrate-binding protein [Thermoleophilaceae bacterium]|nr:ABC transporter substrate-binding protein [Thermoleophilaceae bacterium]
MTLTRRTLLAGGGAALALAACGDSDEPGGGRAAAGRGSFPAKVPHKFGTTVVRVEPRRVATYGGGDVDTLLALGVAPVLVPDIDPRWKRLGGVAPWSRERLGGTEPVVVSNEQVDFERVAEVRPDLVTAVEFDMKRGDYDKLTELAPTVAPPSGYAPYTVPWDVMAVQVGAALGRRAQARRLVRAARSRIAAAARANPAFGRSRAVLIDPDDDGGVYIFAPNDVRTRFLSDLGFTMPAAIEELFEGQFYATLSAERLDMLDEADVLVLVATREPQTANTTGTATYRRVRAVREERVVRIDDPDLAIAMSYSSVLSIPYQLREIVPALRAALA